jgi:plastocyanin
MKHLLGTLLIFICSYGIQAQNSHTLIGFDHGYNPDTLYMAPGDTVHFISQGYHSATEIDSVDWVNNVDNHNGGFDVGFGAATSDMWFVINTVGKYYYICEPHASMGMKGVIYVQQGVSIEEAYNSDNYQVYQLSENVLQLEYNDADQVDIFDMGGKLVESSSLDIRSGQQQIQINLSEGLYIFRFSKEGHLRVNTKKFIE